MEPVKEGSYSGKGFGTPELGESKEKKSEFVNLAIKIQGGENDGRVVGKDFYFSGGALPYTLDALRTLGCTFPGNDITNFEGFGTAVVNFTVVHEHYEKDGEQKTVAKIGFVNKSGGIKEEAKMDEARKAAFRQKMLGTLASTAPKGNGTVAGGKAPF